MINQGKHIDKCRKDKEADIDDGLVVSESDGDDPTELFQVQDPLDAKGKAIILKKRATIRRKAKRDIAKRIAERRFLQRRGSKRLGRIEKEYPSIGKTIKEFVRKQGVGADSWCRTGVLTFDGNRRMGKFREFKIIYRRSAKESLVIEQWCRLAAMCTQKQASKVCSSIQRASTFFFVNVDGICRM